MEQTLSLVVVKNARAVVTARGIKQPALVKLGVSAGTAHRVTAKRERDDPGQNIKIDTLGQLASALKLKPWMLLMDGYDDRNPPVVMTTKKLEEEINRRAKRLAIKMLHEMEGLGYGDTNTEEERGAGGEPVDPKPDEGGSAEVGSTAAPRRKSQVKRTGRQQS